MTIKTRFNVGDEVVFISADSIYRREIKKISVETCNGATGEVSITYHFSPLHGGIEFRQSSPFYKYENEVYTSVEELTKNAHIS